MARVTRRSRAAAAAAAESASQDASPGPASQPSVQHATSLTVDIPEDLDFDFLSTILPDTRLDSPTPESILSLYRLIVSQASDADAAQRELEEARAEVSRKDVELDQALQDRETASKDLETTLENVQRELDLVKQEKEELVVSKAELQARLTAISSTQTTSSAEADALKHRVEDTEREKRDLIGIVSRLKEDATQREEEIKSLRMNLKQARQDHQALETQVRELSSTETATKFKIESLTQQLKLAKDDAERSSADLAAKSEEYAKYRRTKHTELAQLQAAHDSLVQTHTATESQLKTLQSSHKAQSHQLMQAHGRIQDLTGQLAEQEAAYSTEAAGLKRLVEMMEDREAQAKQIVENIEKEWASVGDRAERREVVLREDIEAQRQRAERAEQRVDELQKVLDRMDRGEFPIPAGVPGSVPATPVRGTSSPGLNGTPDFLSQSMVGLSPTVAMASRVQRGGKTFTEVYSEYIKLQEEHTRKSFEYDEMEKTLMNVLQELEERAPVISQQREEYDRMQSEATLLASQLAQAIAERDTNMTLAQENGQKLTKSVRENELLNKQLNDLGRQVQVLLKELGRRQDPLIPSDEDLEMGENGVPAENIEAVITNNLVLFRSIPALQEQNQKLLKIVRELGAKMEAEEKDYREQLEAEQAVALQEAYAAMKALQQQLEDNKRHSETNMQASIKERDALKAMLARERGAARSLGSSGGGASNETETAKELAEITDQFEVYKTEMGADTSSLREELYNLRHEASQAIAQLAKANAKIEYLEERQHALQQDNITLDHNFENASMRNHELIDKYTRVDMQCEQLATDLMSANALIEQMRNDTANLRAEKNIWESVQTRLIDENKALSVERSHLADLMVNVQRMHSDLERSGENDRRRLESQIQMLENQTQDLRTQLSQERDAVRHLSLQKDLELKELRTRIDKNSEEYAKTREALVSAQTSKTHLEEQVDRLNRQLQGNEEKLAVYERRASGVPGAPQPVDHSLSQEQQLESEVAELRSQLKVAEVDLAAARSHVQQFQDISQASEAALVALSSTYDEYKASTEAQIAKHESEYHALQEKLQSVQNELQQLSSKNVELQRTLETERAAWAQDKRTLEDTIVDMTTSEQGTESERTAHANEIRQLEERAKAAEDRYGREVLAHADAIKTVDALRQQVGKAEASARSNLTAVETAQVKLAASEASWKQQKDALDKELSDLQVRNKELTTQNGILHQHLESVSSQAAKIRQAAESSASTSYVAEAGDDADTKLSELRSVVAYLRKEKEIVDLQLELSKQENTRLRSQVEHLSSTLEETRKTLSEERERAVEAAASEAQQAQLLERINQLNILRESNATLRADCESHAKKARALETKLQQLTSELEPTKEQLQVAKAELDAREAQVKRLEDETRKWQERNTQLLTKYDRIDPAEVLALKEQIAQLTAAKTELESSTTSRQSTDADKITELETRIRELRDVGKKNNDITKRRFEQDRRDKESLSSRISELEQQLQQTIAERDGLKALTDSSPVDALNQQLQALREEKTDLERRLQEAQALQPAGSSAELEASLAQITQERDALLTEKATWSASPSATEGAPQQWETEKTQLVKARDDAQAHAKRASDRVHNLAEELKGLRQNNTKLATQLQEVEKERAAEKERLVAQQQAAVEAAVSKVKAEAPAPAAPEDTARHAEELRALEERLSKKHEEELKIAVESAKAAALKESVPGDAKAAIDAAIAAREAELKAAHEQEIAQAVDRGRMEAGAKAKLKDAQIVRFQNKVKELEAQMESLKKQGVAIPAAPAAASAAKLGPTASTSNVKATPTAPANAAAKPAPSPTTTKAPHPPVVPTGPAAQHRPAHAPAKAGGPASLPQRPGGAVGHHVPGPHAVRGRGATRGRGVAAAAGLAIRGAGAGPAEAASSEGVSIAGAAGKRPREEGETSGDDSLVKRMRGEGTGRPIIQRNRVQPPPPGS